MPVLEGWQLSIDVDQIFRRQGADPNIIRTRSPKLVQYAEKSLDVGRSLIEPKLLYKRVSIEEIRHEKLILEDGNSLSGRLITDHFAPASEVLVILCTIGSQLEEEVTRSMEKETLQALALDDYGSAAVEALANSACRRFEEEGKSQHLNTSIPLSPGMEGWPVEIGQPQIFRILPSDEIDVRLTDSYLMIPRKSLSMIIGVGEGQMLTGTTCDYCSLKETCRYQDHFTEQG